MTIPPSIRSAVVTDAPGIAALSGALSYPADPRDIAERLERLLARDDQRVLVAGTPEVALAGWVHAALQEPLESGRVCEILGLVVAEPARGQGAGRALVDAVDAWARGWGCGVSVRSNVVRQESHRFYERIGFTRIKTQHAYRREPAREVR